jgi:hypothetical protein
MCLALDPINFIHFYFFKTLVLLKNGDKYA